MKQENDQSLMIVPDGVSIYGNIVTKGNLDLGGEIKGDVHGRDILVRWRCNVHGDIVGDHVIVQGLVIGIVKAKRIAIGENAHMEGNLIYEESVSIATGAFFEGKTIKQTLNEKFSL